MKLVSLLCLCCCYMRGFFECTDNVCHVVVRIAIHSSYPALLLLLLFLYLFHALRLYVAPKVSKRAAVPLPPALSILTLFSVVVHCVSSFLGSLFPSVSHTLSLFLFLLLLLRMILLLSYVWKREISRSFSICPPSPLKKRRPYTAVYLSWLPVTAISLLSSCCRLFPPLFCSELSFGKNSLPVFKCLQTLILALKSLEPSYPSSIPSGPKVLSSSGNISCFLLRSNTYVHIFLRLSLSYAQTPDCKTTLDGFRTLCLLSLYAPQQ